MKYQIELTGGRLVETDHAEVLMLDNDGGQDVLIRNLLSHWSRANREAGYSKYSFMIYEHTGSESTTYLPEDIEDIIYVKKQL